MNAKNKSREESMQKLSQAGLTVFAEHGFDKATTRMVADKAGVNESLINRYFDGKAGLLRAIIVEFIHNLSKSGADYPAGKTLEEELYVFLKVCLAPCSDNMCFIRLVISRALVDADLSSELNQKHQHPAEVLLLNRLKAYQKKGLISKKRDLQNTIEFLHFVVTGIVFETAVGGAEKVGDIESKLKKYAKQLALDLTA